jgi:hypothetical protein
LEQGLGRCKLVALVMRTFARALVSTAAYVQLEANVFQYVRSWELRTLCLTHPIGASASTRATSPEICTMKEFLILQTCTLGQCQLPALVVHWLIRMHIAPTTTLITVARPLTTVMATTA